MQNILILGASSQMGRELALLFAPHNTLTLVGRNPERLQAGAKQCLEAGARFADLIVHDMANGADSLLGRLRGMSYDLVINLVAETSRVKDSEFMPDQLERYLMADLLVPVQLMQGLIDVSAKPLKMVFISSILAEVKSPDRTLYGDLKALQEICLKKLAAARPGVTLMVVRVAKVLPHGYENPETKRLASAIYAAHRQNKSVLNYGLIGRIYFALFYFQPLLFNVVVKFQRFLRASLARP